MRGYRGFIYPRDRLDKDGNYVEGDGVFLGALPRCIRESKATWSRTWNRVLARPKGSRQDIRRALVLNRFGKYSNR